MGATEPVKALGGSAIKPVGWDRSGWESFKYMLYNPDTGEVLTRTPLSWLKITAFYMVYYSCLAAFWIGCLQIFFLTLPEGRPRWQAQESLIGANPGVGLRPHTSDANIHSSLFLLDTKDVETKPTNKDGVKGEGELMIDIVTRLDMFMIGYKNDTNLDSTAGCTGDDKNCMFDPVAILGECASSPYGFAPVDDMINPCFFIKLNKIFGFHPEGITTQDLEDDVLQKTEIYSKMPEDIKAQITATSDKVYFECGGRFQADREAMDIKFFPEDKSITISKYFPFRGGNYHSPLLAIKVSPKVKNQLIHIECRAWYKGVRHVTKDKEGLTQFEVMII